MIQALVGKKLEQTQRFLADGTRIPVTIVGVSKTSVTQVKTVEKDGYNAVQIAVGVKKKGSKALLGHVKKASVKEIPVQLREVKALSEGEELSLGTVITASDVLKSGDVVKVSGANKGKGFQGGVKRHGFKGGPRTHGQSDRERAPGSIGQTTTPGRVYKGKRMAGHMGTENVTITNLVVVSVDNDQVLLKGLIPGSVNSLVFIEKTGELKNPLELYMTDEQKAAEQARIEAEANAVAEGEQAGETTETVEATPEEVKEVQAAAVPETTPVVEESAPATDEKTTEEPKEKEDKAA